MPANDPQLQSILDTDLDAYEATGILPALRARWMEDDSRLPQGGPDASRVGRPPGVTCRFRGL